MADYYCIFAEKFALPLQAARDFESIVNSLIGRPNATPPEWLLDKFSIKAGELNEFFTEHYDYSDYDCCCDGIEITADKDGKTAEVYVTSESGGSSEAVATLLSLVLAHYRLKDVICLTEVYTCSKPRPGEFGATVVAAWAGGVECRGTYNIERELVEKIKKEMSYAQS